VRALQMALSRSVADVSRDTRRHAGVPGASGDGGRADRVVARPARRCPHRTGVGTRLVRLDASDQGEESAMTGSGPSPRGISRRAAIGAGAGALAAGVLGIPALAGWRGKSSTGIVLRSKMPLPPPFHRA